MRQTTATRMMIAAMILLATLAVANAATLTCEQVTSSSLTIPQSSSQNIQIRCTASGGTVGSVQITPNSNPSSGIVITNTQSIATSISDSTSSTGTWSVRGDSPNSYTVSYTVTSDGTESFTPPATTSITVTSPAQLIVSYMNAPSIFVEGGNLNYKIQNIGGTDASNVKVKLNSGTIRSFGSTVTAGGQASGTWTSSTGYSQAGTYTTYVYNGDTQHDSAITTVSSGDDQEEEEEENNNQNPGGGGGGGAAPTSSTETLSWDTIAAGSAATMSIDNADIPVSEIKVTLSEDSADVSLSVTGLSTKPSTVAEEVDGTVYKYLSITHMNIDEKLDRASIRFKVTKAWVDENGFRSSQVKLMRFDGTDWVPLATSMSTSDDTYYYYTAITTSFSNFAIAVLTEDTQAPADTGASADTGSAPSDTTGSVPSDTAGPDQGQEQFGDLGDKRGPKDYMNYIILGIILLALILIFVPILIRKRLKNKKLESEIDDVIEEKPKPKKKSKKKKK